ncbi:ABC transporter ATP-binding protein [Novacetimonas cocois]|uniref:ABC transporter n=1 Tax=Novacetimonas cocois TaxID=1747507 RepID=A0A365YSS9_9PROT|nr:ABC transporter ATP-binding protein [Novacetimonas cocois]RBM05891.1 ABC transporter [Novacetimonas cocois]
MTQETDVTIPDGLMARLRQRPVSFVTRYVRRHLGVHVLIMGAIVLAMGCGVSTSYIIRRLVNAMAASPAPDISVVWAMVIVFCVVILIDGCAWRVAGWLASGVFVEVGGDIRRDLFRYLTGHSAAYFSQRMSGALSARISTAANAVFSIENLTAWTLLPSSLNIIMSIGMLMTVSPWMALSIVGMTVGAGCLIFLLGTKGRTLHRAYATQAAENDGEMLDIVNNMPLVRAYGMTARECLYMGQRIRHETGLHRRSLRYLEKLRMFHAGLTMLMTAGLLIWVVMLWRLHRATIGDVVMVTTLGFVILNCTRDLAFALVEAVQHVSRLSETLDRLLLPHETVSRLPSRSLLPRSHGRISIRDACFSYPGGRPVLSHFNLEIGAGTRVGLVGQSGSGKSTLLALLQRQRFLQEGQILIDGIDILQLDEESMRGCMAVVAQEVALLRRSVRDNIRYGCENATDAEVAAAASAAGCHDFIMAMPQQFDTIVGERGVMLSGGQRQRIAIARAFLRNAPILILDEATSALDSQSEKHVQEALDRLKAGRTVIAVAHRLSTLQGFDRIVVMDHGRIVQDGSMSELENMPGIYRDVLMQQDAVALVR